MFMEIDLKARQPLVWGILCDIYDAVGPHAHLDLEEFIELLEDNCCNRQTRERTKMIFDLWDEDQNGDIDLFNMVAIS